MAEYRLDSDARPGLDGYVDAASVLAYDSPTLLIEPGSRCWFIFEGAAAPPLHRIETASLRLVPTSLSQAVVVRISAFAAGHAISSLMELESVSPLRGYERTIAAGLDAVELDVASVVNEWIDAAPSHAGSTGLGLLVETLDGSVAFEVHSGSAADEESRPRLNVEWRNTANVWLGVQPVSATVTRITVRTAVAGAAYTIDIDDRGSASHVASAGQTPADIAAALAQLLRPYGDVRHTLGMDWFDFEFGVRGRPAYLAGSASAAHVQVVRPGRNAETQVAIVALDPATSGGHYTLTCDWGGGPETTAPIAWDATPAEVQSALEALPTPLVGDVQVASGGSKRLRIEFGGSLAGTNADLSVDDSGATMTRASITRIQDAGETGPSFDVYAIYPDPDSHPDVELYTRARLDSGAWSEPFRFLHRVYLAASVDQDAAEEETRVAIASLFPTEARSLVRVVRDSGSMFLRSSEYDPVQIPQVGLIVVPSGYGALNFFSTVGLNSGVLYQNVRRPVWFFSALDAEVRPNNCSRPYMSPREMLFEYGGFSSPGSDNHASRFTAVFSGSRDGSHWSGVFADRVRLAINQSGFPGDSLDFDRLREVHLRRHDDGRGGTRPGFQEGVHFNMLPESHPFSLLFRNTGRFVIAWDGSGVPPLEDFALSSSITAVYEDFGGNRDESVWFRPMVRRLTGPTPILNQIDRITLSASAGTFTLTVETHETAPISHPASPADVASSIAAAVGEDVADVSAVGGSDFEIEWVGSLAAEPVSVAVDGSGLTGPGAAIIPVRSGTPAVNEIQRIIMDQAVYEGRFRFSDPLSGSAFSELVPWNASVSQMQAAADRLFGAGRSSWTGVDESGPWEVEFIAAPYSGRPLAPMRLDQVLLRSLSPLIEVEYLAEGTGPNRYDDPQNWSLRRVPETHDVVVFMDGASDVLYGIVQMGEFSAAPGDGALLVNRNLALRSGMRVRLRSTGRLPSTDRGQISEDVDFVVESYDRLAGVIRVFAVEGPLAGGFAFTDEGDGVHYIGVVLDHLYQYMSYTGSIGLAYRTETGVESLPRHLRVGLRNAATLGLGTGSGSRRIMLDLGPWPVSVAVHGSGQGRGAEPAVQLLSASLDLINYGGSVGLAVRPDEHSTFRRLLLVGGQTRLGLNVAAAPGAVIDRHPGADLACDGCAWESGVLILRG